METSRSVPFPGRIGRYELLVPIGAGGVATVYLARVLVVDAVHRPVAIKLMHPELRTLPRAVDELIEEAKLVGSIRHPNVVKVIDAGENAGYVYLVFDYVEGDTLAGVLATLRKQSQTLPLSIAAKIATDMLSGLQAAHQLTDASGKPARVIHRDVSPQNILVGVDGFARIIDFGIAKAVSRLSMTATGIVKGKVGYMAPEQARGSLIDQRTDVWASGVVVWELLSGRRLFREKTDVATLAKIASDEPTPSVRRFRPDVPEAVDAVVARALAKQPSDRFESAAEMRAALGRALTGSIPIAEAEDVGAFVARLVESMLAERRSKASQIIELHAKVDALDLSAGLDASAMSTAEVTRTEDMPHAELEPTKDEPIAPPRPNRKALFVSAAVAAIALPVAALAWTANSIRTRAEPERATEITSVPEPAAASTTAAPVVSETTEIPLSATAPTSSEAPRARVGKPVRPTRKRAVETVSGAQKIQLEPPPYAR